MPGTSSPAVYTPVGKRGQPRFSDPLSVALLPVSDERKPTAWRAGPRRVRACCRHRDGGRTTPRNGTAPVVEPGGVDGVGWLGSVGGGGGGGGGWPARGGGGLSFFNRGWRPGGGGGPSPPPSHIVCSPYRVPV